MSTPRSLPATLARRHAWAQSQPALRRFTLANRLLLAMAFLPTGLVKATNQRFTLLPMENPVGLFFQAMYQTGPYWIFIGLAAAAVVIIGFVLDLRRSRASQKDPVARIVQAIASRGHDADRVAGQNDSPSRLSV